MTEVIMPKMGDGMEEGTLVEWLKKEGDRVKTGDVIGTIQTDKATLELEAPGTGNLLGILISAGETVPVGKPIAAIVKEGEKLPTGWGGGEGQVGTGESLPSVAAPAGTGAPASAPLELQQAATTPIRPEGASAEFGINPEPKAPTGEPSRIKASPLAKKIASERGLDLAKVSGSGPGGRIVEKDVLAASPASAPVAQPQQPAAQGQESSVSLNRIRQITAKRTTESKQQVPHFYVTVEVDVEGIVRLRQMFEEQGAGKVSVNDFVIKACALALREMPEVNATYQGTTLQMHSSANIGMAVALPDGLTVPVIKNADTLTLRQISAKSKELAGKARDNKLGMEELSGSTFSISNMGMLDVDNFVAIINQPNAAIVAIASIRKRVVATDDGEIEVRSRMNITGSFDHRVVDGAIGARFMNVVRAYLENPVRLLS